ncbi:MAG: TIM barrel protein [Spirochaetaceae bacterium]
MNSANKRVSVQTVLPEDFRENRQFREEMNNLKEEGYEGVELNMAHPGVNSLESILSFLEEYQLKLTNFASGLTAKTYGLSLSHRDEVERQRAVKKVKEIIRFLDGSSIGIILGFFKGPKAEHPEIAHLQFSRSIADLFPVAEEKKIPLIVEATNRYESSVAHSLKDAFEFVKEFNSPYAKILPDTYHMNIEESDMYAALKKYLPYYHTVHLSDNNRFFPGFGAMNFEKIIQHFEDIGYKGGFAIEGQIVESFVKDCSAAIRFLNL